MTQTEVAEFLERMPKIRNELMNLSASPGYMWIRLDDALDVIDFLVAELNNLREAVSPGRIAKPDYYIKVAEKLRILDGVVKPQEKQITQIRREAFLGAASVYCEACKNEGAPTLESNGLHFHSQALHGCTSFKIWCKLAEEDGG